MSSPRLRVLAFSGLIALVLIVLLIAVHQSRAGKVNQPIQFNHKLHVDDLGLECTECHRYVKTEEFAGRPVVAICADCHESPQTDSAEEEILLQFIESGEEIPWRRLYEVPSHVFYSHRRHVSVAGINCSECHGKLAETTSPPSKALKKLSMNFCMGCHERRHVSNDCSNCHR